MVKIAEAGGTFLKGAGNIMENPYILEEENHSSLKAYRHGKI